MIQITTHSSFTGERKNTETVKPGLVSRVTFLFISRRHHVRDKSCNLIGHCRVADLILSISTQFKTLGRHNLAQSSSTKAPSKMPSFRYKLVSLFVQYLFRRIISSIRYFGVAFFYWLLSSPGHNRQKLMDRTEGKIRSNS